MIDIDISVFATYTRCYSRKFEFRNLLFLLFIQRSNLYPLSRNTEITQLVVLLNFRERLCVSDSYRQDVRFPS